MIRGFEEVSKTWYLLANSIRLLKDIRIQIEKKSKSYDTLSINLVLILTSAAVVEGAISSLLTQHLNRSNNYKEVKHKNSSEIKRIYDNLLDKIESSSWSEIKSLFELITNHKLQLIGNENWEAVDILFNYRNLLAHGGVIVNKIEKISDAESVEEIQNEELIEKHSRKKLFEYLEKTGKLNKEEKYNILRLRYISSEIADHFVDHAKKFLEKVFNHYLQNFGSNNTLKNEIETISKM